MFFSLAGTAGLIVCFFLLWTAASLFFSLLPVPSGAGAAAHTAISLVCLALYFLLAASLSHRLMHVIVAEKPGRLKMAFLAVILLFLFFYVMSYRFDGAAMIVSSLATANLLIGATLFGTVLSSAVKRVGELVPLCLTAAAADLMSVAKGPTSEMIADISEYYQEGMTGTAPFVDHILVKAGLPGFAMPVPLFGVTDWILVVLLSASLLRLNHSDNLLPGRLIRGTFLFMPVSAAALYIGILTAQLTGLFMPAMVFIALFFIAYLNIKLQVYRNIQKTDVIYSVLLPGAVILVILVLAG